MVFRSVADWWRWLTFTAELTEPEAWRYVKRSKPVYSSVELRAGCRPAWSVCWLDVVKDDKTMLYMSCFLLSVFRVFFALIVFIILCAFHVFVSWLFWIGCQYQYRWLTGKALASKVMIKLNPTHSLTHQAGDVSMIIWTSNKIL